MVAGQPGKIEMLNRSQGPCEKLRRQGMGIKNGFASTQAWLKNCLKFVRDFMYGATIHELDLELRKEKGHLDQLFMLVVFGDLVGLPLLPPYYSMRLLPYIVPSIETWKRRLLREKDLTDFVAGDL
jgi:hypothetical protein